MTKKRTVYILIFLIAVIVIAVAGAYALRSTIKPAENVDTGVISTDDNKDVLKSDAEAEANITKAKEARRAGDHTAAISAYQKARTYYENAGNIEKTADMDLAISLLESEKNNMPETPEAKPIGTR